MAVKVMWAPVVRAPPAARNAPIAPEDDSRSPAPAPERPRRRRSAVYDADGNEVFITLMCLKCHKMRPLSQFGLRRMTDGAIRNQPWCRPCRSDAGPKKRRGTAETVAPSVSEGPPERERTATSDAGILAAQVAAALHNGRR